MVSSTVFKIVYHNNSIWADYSHLLFFFFPFLSRLGNSREYSGLSSMISMTSFAENYLSFFAEYSLSTFTSPFVRSCAAISSSTCFFMEWRKARSFQMTKRQSWFEQK